MCMSALKKQKHKKVKGGVHPVHLERAGARGL